MGEKKLMNKQAGAALGQTQLKRDKALLQLTLSGRGAGIEYIVPKNWEVYKWNKVRSYNAA